MFTTTVRTRLARGATLAVTLALLAACGGGPAATPAAPTAAPSQDATAVREEPTKAAEQEPVTAGPAKLVAATFAKKLGENQDPVDPTESFFPDETIYLSLEFEGRPKEGVVKSEFFWGEESIAEAEISFADVNSGVLFSVGQSTFAGFNLTHENPLPVSGNYRVVSTLDGEELGTYEFSVVPPEDAGATKLDDAVLARGAESDYTPIDPTTSFTPEETVFLVGSGDFGKQSWMKVEWYVDGKLDDDGTKTLSFEKDSEGTGFSFSYLPEGGWAEGEHEAVLYVNDEEVDRYGFTVGALAEEPTPEEATTALVEIGELETFSPDSGLFTIDVPSGWEFSDNSNDASANYSWSGPTGTAGIIVSLYVNPETLSEEELTSTATEFVTSVFGEEPDFEVIETTPQSDGSVLVAWTATPDIAGPVSIVGLSYIEQREDKVSLLNVIMPEDQYDALWEQGFGDIVNSYKIDPSADIS